MEIVQSIRIGHPADKIGNQLVLLVFFVRAVINT